MRQKEDLQDKGTNCDLSMEGINTIFFHQKFQNLQAKWGKSVSAYWFQERIFNNSTTKKGKNYILITDGLESKLNQKK